MIVPSAYSDVREASTYWRGVPHASPAWGVDPPAPEKNCLRGAHPVDRRADRLGADLGRQDIRLDAVDVRLGILVLQDRAGVERTGNHPEGPGAGTHHTGVVHQPDWEMEIARGWNP